MVVKLTEDLENIPFEAMAKAELPSLHHLALFSQRLEDYGGPQNRRRRGWRTIWTTIHD